MLALVVALFTICNGTTIPTRKEVRNLIGGHNGTINFVFFNKN